MKSVMGFKNARIILFVMVIGFSMVLAGCKTTQTVTTIAPGTSGQMISEVKPGSEQERFESRMKLAVAYFQGGRDSSATALAEVNRALELRPRSAEALALKGMIYDQMGDTGNAIAYLRNAVSNDSSNGDLNHNLGTMLCNHSQYADGIAYLEKAVSLPNNTNVTRSWLMIGECYQGAGNIQKAETAYHQVLYLEPSNRAALYQLSNFMYLRNDIIGAKEYLERMGSIRNMNAPALWLGVKIARTQGDAYLMGQYAKALRDRYPSSIEAAALNRGDYHL